MPKVIDLPTATSMDNGDYLLMEESTGGTKKITLSNSHNIQTTETQTINANETVTFSVPTNNYDFFSFKFAIGGERVVIVIPKIQLLTVAQSYYVPYAAGGSTAPFLEMIINRTSSTITIKRNGSVPCSCSIAYWN